METHASPARAVTTRISRWCVRLGPMTAEIRSPGYALPVHRSPNKNRKSRGALPGLASMAVASAIDSHGGVAFDEQVKVVGADVSIDIRTAGWPTHLDSFSLRDATQP